MATIELGSPNVGELGEAVGALRQWQDDAEPMQLHPGDVGWYWQSGAVSTAAAVRTWRRDGRIVAVGLLDGAELMRLTTDPELRQDESLAQHLVDDLTAPQRGILPAGRVAVEAPSGAMVMDLLSTHGWKPDTPWTPLRRDLAEPVPDVGLRFEIVGPDRAHLQTAVHQASFGSGRFTAQRWNAMASGAAFSDASSLVGFDSHGEAVAMVIVWSAGPGRPGLLEPMGVHPDHWGKGYGTAISMAAASALRDLGASSAMVCTPSENVGAVATYRAAGFQQLPERRDRYREA